MHPTAVTVVPQIIGGALSLNTPLHFFRSLSRVIGILLKFHIDCVIISFKRIEELEMFVC